MESSSRLTYSADERKQYGAETLCRLIGQKDSKKKDRRVIPLLGVQVKIKTDGQLSPVPLLDCKRLRMRRKKTLGLVAMQEKNRSTGPRDRTPVENGPEPDGNSFVAENSSDNDAALTDSVSLHW